MAAWPAVSIRTRLTIAAATASLVTVVFGGVVLTHVVDSSNESALTDELRVHAQDVADEIAQGSLPTLTSGIETQVLSATGDSIEPVGEVSLLTADELDQVPAGGMVFDRRVSGSALAVFATPVVATDGSTQIVVAATSTGSLDRAQHRLTLIVVGAGVLMVLAATLAAWLVSGAALRPVRAMTRRARALSADGDDQRLPVPPGRDQISELGETLNQLLGRLTDARRRERAFVDDASHELRAPLAVIRAELEMALLEVRDHAGPVDTEAALVSALEEAERLSALANDLLSLARADAGMLDEDRGRVSVAALARSCADRIDHPGVTISIDGQVGEVTGNPMAIEQVVTNLLVNATRWAATRVSCQIREETATVVLRVGDDGPGFDSTYMQHAFERFRRGDPARGRGHGGGGLGLAIAATIVAGHGGRIRLGNGAPLGGAWVEVTLPAAPTVDDDRGSRA